MTRANPKTGRWRVWQPTRTAGPNNTTDGDGVTARPADLCHRPYPPASALQALAIDHRHPASAADMRTYTGLDILLRARGWRFIPEYSGPQQLTFAYRPCSQSGLGHPNRGLEPVTTIVVTVDRSGAGGTATGSAVEIRLAGARLGQPTLTTLADFVTHLGVIEAHRTADPASVAFPVERAGTEQHVRDAAPSVAGNG